MTDPNSPKSSNQQHREIAAALASHIGAPAFWPSASASENARGIVAYLRQGLPGAPAAQPATPAVDPHADPLSTLTAIERAELEADPQLKKRFLAHVDAAEADGREKRERAKLLAETYAAHDAREQTDLLAQRAIELRAKARGGQ
jgi:hypothetical protein